MARGIRMKSQKQLKSSIIASKTKNNKSPLIDPVWNRYLLAMILDEKRLLAAQRSNFLLTLPMTQRDIED